jgi:hypothetical protein
MIQKRTDMAWTEKKIKEARKEVESLYDPMSLAYNDGYAAASIVRKYGMSLNELFKFIGTPSTVAGVKWTPPDGSDEEEVLAEKKSQKPTLQNLEEEYTNTGFINGSKAIMGYLAGRCDVRSQHKLPTLDELEESTTIGLFLNHEELRDAIEALVELGRVFKYGPHYSDRKIDVL